MSLARLLLGTVRMKRPDLAAYEPLQPSSVHPTQFFAGLERLHAQCGERRLMVAVLEEAFSVYCKNVLARRPRLRRLFQEAEAWFESDDRSWVFSFERVCETLGLDAGCVRQLARERKRQTLAAHAAAQAIQHDPGLRQAVNH
jgi:hypothetical protein